MVFAPTLVQDFARLLFGVVNQSVGCVGLFATDRRLMAVFFLPAEFRLADAAFLFRILEFVGRGIRIHHFAARVAFGCKIG